MNVLIIPEDFRNDQYILKPLFDRLVRDRPSVHILICRDPLLGGVGEALKSERISEIMEKYRGRVDIFILCVDRDGEAGRRQRLDQLEDEFRNGPAFLAENAWEEIETWATRGPKPSQQLALGRHSGRERCQGNVLRTHSRTARLVPFTWRWPRCAWT